MICKWCYHSDITHEPDKIIDPETLEAMEWLGIKKKNICKNCTKDIKRLTERISQNFLRPYNVMLNLWPTMPYSRINYELKKIGWCAFLHDHLRERVFGHYFQAREEMFKEGKLIYKDKYKSWGRKEMEIL